MTGAFGVEDGDWAALLARARRTATALLARRPELARAADEEGQTVLFHALRAGQLDVARCWLEAGADPDHLDREGFAVVHDMAKRDDVAAVELLVRHGADVNLGTGLGLTPAAPALRYGAWKVLGFLVAHGADLRKSAIAGAAVADQYEAVRALPRVLHAGIDRRLGKRPIIPVVAQAALTRSAA